MLVEFVTIAFDTPCLLPSSVQDYLPEDHLARFEREQVEDVEKLARRTAKQERTGKKPAGRPPKALSEEPRTKDQVSPPVPCCEVNSISPYILEGRQGHNEPLHERLVADPPEPPGTNQRC